MDKNLATEAEEQIVSDDVEEVETEEVETEEAETGAGDENEQEEPELADEPEADDGSILVKLSDEEGEDEGSQPLRELRKRDREAKKRIRELEAKLADQDEVKDAGPKPTLKDFDYDEAKFEAAYDAWRERNKAAEDRQRKQREAQEAAAERSRKIAQDLEAKQEAYVARARTAGFKDFDEAQAAFEDTLPEVVRSTITDNAANPEIIVMALHQNPELAEKFKGANDVRTAINAAWELSKLESKLKTATPKSKPKPEGRVEGSTRPPQTSDKQLEKLEQEAARTGDRTKVQAYKRQLKSKGK